MDPTQGHSEGQWNSEKPAEFYGQHLASTRMVGTLHPNAQQNNWTHQETSLAMPTTHDRAPMQKSSTWEVGPAGFKQEVELQTW